VKDRTVSGNTAVAVLTDGPLAGEIVGVTASTRVIALHRTDGTFASYSRTGAGRWRYDGIARHAASGLSGAHGLSRANPSAQRLGGRL
jgi:hypothetical protein